MKTLIITLVLVALSMPALAAKNWSRGSGSSTVTVDTRGINAGTAEGRTALRQASQLFQLSRGLGSSTSPQRARSFNSQARQVSRQVNRVSGAHRAAAQQRARSERFVRDLVKSRAGRR